MWNCCEPLDAKHRIMKSSQANVDISQTEPGETGQYEETSHNRNVGTLIKRKGLALLPSLSTLQLCALSCARFPILIASRKKETFCGAISDLSTQADIAKRKETLKQQDQVPGSHLLHFLYASQCIIPILQMQTQGPVGTQLVVVTT